MTRATSYNLPLRLPSWVAAVLAAAVLSVVAASAAAQDTTGVGAISGVVVNAAGRPTAGVRVCALDTAECATSDARGAFRIGELRSGAYRLEILPLAGLPFTSDPVDVRAGLDGTVEITLPSEANFQEDVTVTAPAFRAPEAVKTSGFLVEPRAVLKSAAALQDVSRYVQGLPGVAIGTNDFRNDIIVRGGSPLENLFVVDNVEIPNINRLRQLRVGRRHGEPARCRAPGGCDLPHRRLPRALHQPHVERAAGDAARGQPQEVRRVGHARLRRRGRHPRRAHQRDAEDSREGETTIKYDLTVHLPFFDTVQTGGSFKTFRINYTAESPLGNDTPYSRVPGIDPFFLDTRFRSYQTGAYLQASRQVTPRVNVTLGGRVDHYDILSQARVSPRAGVEVRLTDALSWSASAGSYYQQPAFLFVSAFPQNASLVPWRADHYVTGLAWSHTADVRVTAETYRKTYRDYPVASDLPTVSLANIGDTFDVREILFPLTSAGKGYSEGVEFFVEKRLTAHLYGRGNLSLSRTRHAGLDGVLRPGSFDYPFVFNLLGGYRLSPRWELSARLSFLSGRPFTPYDQAESTAQRRGVYDLSRVNAERAPDYGRVDIRVDRTFTAGGRPLDLFLGVQNVTNRRNFANYSWNRRTNTQQFGEQQDIFPIVGLDWRF